jgi:hypothetical protein
VGALFGQHPANLSHIRNQRSLPEYPAFDGGGLHHTHGYLSILVVMGGATRTLVAHLLRNEPVTASATYKAVRARFWGLVRCLTHHALLDLRQLIHSFLRRSKWSVWSSSLLWFCSHWSPSRLARWELSVSSALCCSSCLAVWLFFLIVSRIVYVPQVMLVEGKGVFEAVGRSFSLARWSTFGG